ncbi:MAG: hypothetical protein ACO1G6_12740 [Bacteroidota bacterium]
MRILMIFTFLLFVSIETVSAQDSTAVKKNQYQIFLNQPAKTIKYILYDKDFLPIQGELSEDKKSVIMKNYKTGAKVRLKVEYEDGTSEEIIKSPCFIDPVIS